MKFTVHVQSAPHRWVRVNAANLSIANQLVEQWKERGFVAWAEASA